MENKNFRENFLNLKFENQTDTEQKPEKNEVSNGRYP
jgi:hypothetical protein